MQTSNSCSKLMCDKAKRSRRGAHYSKNPFFIQKLDFDQSQRENLLAKSCGLKSKCEHFMVKKLWVKIQMWAFYGKKVVSSNPNVSIFWKKSCEFKSQCEHFLAKSRDVKSQCEHIMAKLNQISTWAFFGKNPDFDS